MSNTFLRGKLSTKNPLNGRINNAVIVYPDNTNPIMSFEAPKFSLR